MAWLLGRYSAAYASNQFRALQQFFKWLAAEEENPDPMAGLRPPHVPDKPVPVFADRDLPRLERACAGRSFQQRRDAAMIAVFTATGIFGVKRGGDPAVRAGRHPVRPGRPAAQRRRRVAAGDHRPRQGPQDPHGQDQLRCGAQPGPVPARPCPARPGVPAAAVARREQQRTR